MHDQEYCSCFNNSWMTTELLMKNVFPSFVPLAPRKVRFSTKTATNKNFLFKNGKSTAIENVFHYRGKFLSILIFSSLLTLSLSKTHDKCEKIFKSAHYIILCGNFVRLKLNHWMLKVHKWLLLNIKLNAIEIINIRNYLLMKFRSIQGSFHYLSYV